MDTQSWSWRRKSSEEDIESSHFRRISDELVCMNSETQSTEKILKEKLLAALENIKEKESLVNQHARVAEEAITGWEKAEKEASDLKQKASSLEDRVIQLDGALKECLKQLREATRIDLKLELQERYEQLEILTIERDRSIQLAETVGKQHLESVKKVSELEIECQRLQDSSVGRNRLSSPSVEIISLMDDFLEMERLVALAELNKNDNFSNISKEKLADSETRRSFSIDTKHGIELENTEKVKGDVKTTRDKEVTIAARRLVDCMKTIASLNRQLKSLATFEDFFVDFELSIEDVPKNEMLHLNWAQVAIL